MTDDVHCGSCSGEVERPYVWSCYRCRKILCMECSRQGGGWCSECNAHIAQLRRNHK